MREILDLRRIAATDPFLDAVIEAVWARIPGLKLTYRSQQSKKVDHAARAVEHVAAYGYSFPVLEVSDSYSYVNATHVAIVGNDRALELVA